MAVRNGKATWTSVLTSNLVNAFRYGLDTDRQADGFDQAELGGGLGYLDVSVAGVQLGPATYLPRVEPLEVRNEFADDVSWAKGKHMIKVGVHLRARQRQRQLSQQPVRVVHLSDGDLVRAGLQRQHRGRARLFGVHAKPSAIPLVDYALKDIGIYLKDQWKVNDRLTVTLGARYEHTFMPPPPHGQSAVPADRGAAAPAAQWILCRASDWPTGSTTRR